MSVHQEKPIGSYLIGDEDPEDFDFAHYFTPEELLVLLVTSPPIQKQCVWLPSQALSPWLTFKNDDSAFKGLKFGEVYTFDSFTDWVYWSGVYEEILKSMIWSTAFGSAACVFFTPNDIPTEDEKGVKTYGELTEVATKSQAFYPLIGSNGYRISKLDEWGEPEMYELNYKRKDKEYTGEAICTEKITYYAHASRVVEFNSLSLEMGYKGTSKMQTTAHLATIQRQMLRAVFNQMKNLAAGIAIVRANGDEEKNTVKTAMEAQYSHLSKIYYQGDKALDDVIATIIPDMKVDQLSKINLMLQKQLAQGSNLSIRTLGEEDIASGLGEGGAGFSHILIKSEIKDIQRHYQKSIEHCFFKLGKTDTAFIWNEPIVKDEKLNKEVSDENMDSEDDNNTNTNIESEVETNE